jgi:hypothetical protein
MTAQRVLFALYTGLIIVGLAYFVALGVLHR